MEIKKADSKGRVSGFVPGVVYAFDRKRGYFAPLDLPDFQDYPDTDSD